VAKVANNPKKRVDGCKAFVVRHTVSLLAARKLGE
jgi:hypothetical protein